jgi:hypothetical protein
VTIERTSLDDVFLSLTGHVSSTEDDRAVEPELEGSAVA